jgi:multidrug resistance efflux pump
MDVAVSRKRRRPGVYLLAAGVLIALVASTVGLGRFDRASPRVTRTSVWIDTVRRGEFTREISAPGSVVSDEVRYVTARVSGVVDRILAKPGAQLEPDAVLLELSNPNLEFDAVEAATAVKEARAELLDLQATLGMQQLEHQSTVANTRVQTREAQRRAKANDSLADRKLVAALDMEQAVERVSELEERLHMEEERGLALQAISGARVAAQRAKLDGLRAQAQLRAELVGSLRVRARAAGVLTELLVEVGQQVTAGTLVGKIVNQHKLKVALNVPEARAKELAVGQSVDISVQNETVGGHVAYVEPAVQQGHVRVEVGFDHEPPKSARLDLSVDGRIRMERASNVLLMRKPTSAAAEAKMLLFRLLPDGRTAERVPVQLGRSSVNTVEVLDGLRDGDRVILSDMSEWNAATRIELE